MCIDASRLVTVSSSGREKQNKDNAICLTEDFFEENMAGVKLAFLCHYCIVLVSFFSLTPHRRRPIFCLLHHGQINRP